MRVTSAVLTVVFATLPTRADAADFELKLSHMFPPTHFIHTQALEPWAKSIEQKSGGMSIKRATLEQRLAQTAAP